MAQAATEALATIEQGYRLLQDGEPQRAQDAFLGVAESMPRVAAAWHGLGNSCAALGDSERSLEFLSKACSLAPQTGMYWGDYGRQLLGALRFAEAAESFSRALQHAPDDLLLHMMYGQALSGMGLETDALNELGYVLERQPDSAPVINLIGNVMRKLGRLDEAAELYRASLQLEPTRYEVWHNLAAVHSLAQRWPEAAACAAEAVHCNPSFWQAHLGLGLSLYRQKLYDDAETCLREAHSLSNGDAEVCLELGNLAMARHDGNEAMLWYRRAIEANPHHAGAVLNAASLFRLNGGIAEALSLARVALRIEPDSSKACNMEGICLSELGRMREALLAYQRAVELAPHDRMAQSNILYNLNFHTAFCPSQVARVHRAWGRMSEHDALTWNVSPTTPALPEKRLRIGYVSGDFRRHSVMYFLSPLLRGHHRNQFEIFCYSNVDCEDEVTADTRRLDVVWRDIAAISDVEVAHAIVRDEIDILVDLGGHTGSSRLTVFASKPAPVQCSYLGYPNTTGLQTIDYRLVDSVTDPPESIENGADMPHSAEALVRIDPVFLCFQAPEMDIPVHADPPCLESGFVTFGTFNNNKKIDIETARAWAALLREIPQSRLLLKCRSYGSEEARRYVLEMLAAEQIAEHRVTFLPGDVGFKSHMERYRHLDIALDTYPYNGTTTTMESLWMGVPVVTLSGKQHASRVGRSILSAVGYPEWAAESAEDFVRCAKELAGQPHTLSLLRSSLRERLRASPLMDQAAFVARIEQFYRKAWRQHCAQFSTNITPAK